MMLKIGTSLPLGLAVRRPRPFTSAIHHVAPSPANCAHVRLLSMCRATKLEATQAQFTPKNAREAIETATRIQKEQKDYTEAVRLYVLAMSMKPNDDEARAALYNMGCALAKQKQWAKATDCILRAINDYNLKLAVALRDDDLRDLRDRREWLDALMEAKGGLSRESKIDLRSEAKAPFRFPRLVLFGGLGIGASVGLFIICFRLVAALKGGPDAPDVQETLQNLGINAAAVVILGALVYRDVQGKQKALKVTEREEALGRLQIDLGGTRQLPLIRLRGQVRPVIISGSRGYVEDTIRAAGKYETELRERGVSVVPIILDEVQAARRSAQLNAPTDPDEKIKALKREFQQQQRDAAKGFGSKDAPASTSDADKQEGVPETKLMESDKKWRLKPYQVVEWKEWLDKQQEFSGSTEELKNVYVQVQLDGTVRSSGRGTPNWGKFVDDIPTLSSVRTAMTDGIGPSEVKQKMFAKGQFHAAGAVTAGACP